MGRSNVCEEPEVQWKGNEATELEWHKMTYIHMPTRCASNMQGACSALKLHFQHWTIFAWGAAECLRSGARAEQIPSIPGALVFLRCLGSQPLVGKKTESHPTLIFFWSTCPLVGCFASLCCLDQSDMPRPRRSRTSLWLGTGRARSFLGVWKVQYLQASWRRR